VIIKSRSKPVTTVHTVPSPPVPAEGAGVLSDETLDRFCQPLTSAELDSLRRQVEVHDRQPDGHVCLMEPLQSFELAVDFLRLYREQHFPHRGAQPTEEQLASLQAQIRLVVECLADLVSTMKSEGLHPVDLIVVLSQLRQQASAGCGTQQVAST